MKKRIAFLGRGVHTLPSYRLLLNRLSDFYDITVFSEVPFDQAWLAYPHNYRIRTCALKWLPRPVNTFILLLGVMLDHIRKPYAIIHSHSTFPTGVVAVLIRAVFRIPIVVGLDGGEGIHLPGIAFGDLHSSRRTRINKWVLGHADVVTTLTAFQKKHVLSNLSITREITVLPRGVDESLFGVGDPSARNRREGWRFLYVGYLSPVKDPMTMLRTFALIAQSKKATLLVIGKDYMDGAVQRSAEELGVRDLVTFLDHVPYGEMPQYYRDSDVLLMTSLFESQNMATMEAMASGVIVAGTRVGILSDLPNDACVSVGLEEYETLAGKIQDVLRDDHRRSEMIFRAKSFVSAYTLSSTTTAWRKIYDAMM